MSFLSAMKNLLPSPDTITFLPPGMFCYVDYCTQAKLYIVEYQYNNKAYSYAKQELPGHKKVIHHSSLVLLARPKMKFLQKRETISPTLFLRNSN